MNKVKLSACIITYNEEGNIRDCLESVKWVDEIIVVDSFSQDKTVEICKSYTERIYQRAWLGHIEQKNVALDLAANEWILALDADERVSPSLAKAISNELLFAQNTTDGYYFPRHSYYLGRWINHGGWYPDYKLRLFRKGSGQWGGKNPHDRVILNGSTKYLKDDLWHYVYRDLSHQLKTVDNFSRIAVEIMEKEEKAFSLSQLLFRPPLKFIETYVIKKGWMDGLPGFIIAVVSSFYVFLKYAKLWEVKQRQNNELDSKRGIWV